MGEFPPQGLNYWAEWRRVVYTSDGERWGMLDSAWYPDESVARSLLNEEYPEPISTGFRYVLQKRWVTGAITVEA